MFISYCSLLSVQEHCVFKMYIPNQKHFIAKKTLTNPLTNRVSTTFSLQYTVSVKHNKVKSNEISYACNNND